ncbi:hypothetical protein BDP27DRAFT_1292211 [Rhodocollybia butyracea]|uniref:Uncharacterized protein n=1 Tax=Rhodocollybia butyracea TaxID=206335 RepID=A0A9P5PY98_9AGAR|nr:hypothetical protein BDP27DRAFT_1292211 [Rhodocollybia butyracea]
MDIDPLADTAPPRYAVESDEEDEYNPLSSRSEAAAQVSTPEIKIISQAKPKQPLVVAFGEAGKYWAKGCKLGEQSGGIYVDGVQVSLIFTPSWSRCTIVVSETFTRLPLTLMHPYAKHLIDELDPSRIIMLDTYPAPTYVSNVPIAFQDAPVRFVGNATSFERFAPPNVIHSTTSAAVLTYAAFAFESQPTLLLLPFPRIPSPPPKTLANSDFSHLSEDQYQWDDSTMVDVHRALLGGGAEAEWRMPSNSSRPSQAINLKNRPMVDGGMFI